MMLKKNGGYEQEGSTFSGLFWGKDNPLPIPLIGVEVAVKVIDFAAKVTVQQAYRNFEDKPIEAVYSFPLPESAAVCGFEVETQDKKLVGKVEESEKAFRLYEEAMDEGHGAFLLEQDRPNVFTANIGNLLPKRSAVVRIVYVQELNASNGNIHLLIPTTISPRYLPLEQWIKMDPVEIDHINPPVVLGKVPYGLRLTTEIDLSGGIRSVRSPSHPVRVDLDDTRAIVTLEGEDIQLDQDFVLNIEPKEPALPVIRLAKDRDEYVAMLTFTPKAQPSPPTNSEIIFLLDRSGSMGGESIDQARNALQICLHSLSQGDRFNIIGFGNSYELMFPECVDYTQKTLDQAIRKIKKTDADLGGTEIYQPLRKALEMDASLPKRIVLITDGQFGNEKEVIRLCRHHKNSVTVFPVGIGRGVNEYALKAIARATGGVAEFIHPNERVEPKIVRQFSRLREAGSKTVRIDWGEYGDGLTIPKELPTLFQGDRAVVFKRIRALKPGLVKVYFGDGDSEECWTIELTSGNVLDDESIPILMVRRRIQELEERLDLDDSGQGDAKRRREIIELGCGYGLISSLTSYVAIETRPDADPSEQAEYRRVPIALTRGWGGVDAGVEYCIATFTRRALKGETVSQMRRWFSSPKLLKVEERRAEADLTHDELVRLINLQKFEGYWEYGPELRELFEMAPKLYYNIAQEIDSSAVMREEIIATILALDLLEKKFKRYESEWRLIALKAYQWLEQQKIDRRRVQEILLTVRVRTALS